MDLTIDLTGQRFTKLLVLSRVPNKGKGKPRTVWLCRCDCGQEKEILSQSLRGGLTKSCGCIMGKYIKVRLKDGEAARRRILRVYKKGATRRNRQWLISEDRFNSLIQSNCSYCGLPPSNKSVLTHSTAGNFRYSGIDRIDSTKNYTDDNTVPCCAMCNRAKYKMSHDSFIQWLKQVAEFYNSKKA
jgi:hypothetical protein